ncbi:hypothetical protein CR969_00845 [Candidatus Saccharibacteria bacterium]|nr:MAG: hypothetical protein CR969_00845 [Candidatus Saccharibacteria bacterium]
MKKVAFFDIDGTLFRWQLYHDLVFELKDMGKFSEDDASNIDRALVDWQAKNKTWLDYELTLVAVFEKNITNVSPNELRLASEAVVKRSGHKIYNYTLSLLRQLQQQGYFTVAISGSGQELVDVFTEIYGFNKGIGRVFETIDGKFSGKTESHTLGRKAEIALGVIKSEDLALDDSFAIGDSGSDIEMLELVKNPIAFNPSTELLEAAQQKGWQIVVERKNIAYTMESQDGSIILAKTDSF